MRRRLLPCLVVVGALLAAAPARADSGAMWGDVATRIATSMEQLQQPDGSLTDYLSPSPQPYSEAMVGYGLLQQGLRRGDRRATTAGLRALGETVRPGVAGGPRLDSVFKQLAVAASYRLAVAKLGADPAFAAVRPALEAWLRQIRPVHLTGTRGAAGNKHLVEAVADLELLRSGLTGSVPGTILAERDFATARVIALIDDRWPALVESQERPGPSGATAVVSDPPSHPLAYHALATAMLQRAIGLLGPAANDRAREALAAMARGSALLAAPDGDLAYWGRSQEQSWALALTAAAASALDPGQAERLRARTALRLVRVHGFGPFGVWIVPALRDDAAAGRAAMDDYAANGVYNGLTLVGAEWALTQAPVAATGTPVGADRDGAWRIGRGGATFAVSRHEDSWFAVRMRAGAGEHRGDPRYAFGLMAAKARDASAGWHDVVAAPPRPLGGAEAAGPSLVLADGTPAEPYGSRMRVRRNGTVTVTGGFRTAVGSVVRRGVHFTFAPRRTGGVAVSLDVRRGDVIEVADFRPVPGGPVRLRLARRVVHTAAAVRTGYASATLGRVVRVGARVRAARAGRLTWYPED